MKAPGCIEPTRNLPKSRTLVRASFLAQSLEKQTWSDCRGKQGTAEHSKRRCHDLSKLSVAKGSVFLGLGTRPWLLYLSSPSSQPQNVRDLGLVRRSHRAPVLSVCTFYEYLD